MSRRQRLRQRSFTHTPTTERGYTLWAEAEVHHTAEADIPEADPSGAAPEEDSAEAAEDREVPDSVAPDQAVPGLADRVREVRDSAGRILADRISEVHGSEVPAGEAPSIPEAAGAVPADGAEDADVP